MTIEMINEKFGRLCRGLRLRYIRDRWNMEVVAVPVASFLSCLWNRKIPGQLFLPGC